jgi:RimJ/RimL family protein N-acetyltransferase
LILEGEHVHLRPLQKQDFEAFCAWYGDDQVTRLLGMEPLSKDKAKIMFNQLLNDQNGVYFGIIKKDNEGIIGYVFLAYILKSHKVAREFGIVISDKKLWGHGYGSEATRLMLEYGFKHLKLHRIELLVLDSNERALHVYRNQGFVQEGIQREARLIEDKWHNVILLGILQKEYFQGVASSIEPS